MLIRIATLSQEKEFGCNITGFIEYFDLSNFSNIEIPNPGKERPAESWYLLFYQCQSQKSLLQKVLKVAMVIIYPLPISV
jgi:hypothetical protein